MMRVWRVALRDYLETVRSGSFIILVLIVPLLLVASIAIPRALERAEGPAEFALVDLPAGWAERLQRAYDADEDIHGRIRFTPRDVPAGVTAAEIRKKLESEVRAERLYGFITAESGPDGAMNAAVTTLRADDDDAARWLMRRALPAVVRFDRARRLGLAPSQIAKLDASVDVKPYVLSASAEGAREASATDRLAAYAPMIFTYLLWIVTFTLTQRLLMTTIEEKSNRTVEVILSSVSPMEFMAGKVLAGVLEGVTVMAVWLFTLFMAADYFTQRHLQGLDITILFSRTDHIAWFCVYFALGFVLFASLTVGLGSLCNSIRETQNIMTPVMMLMVVPILVMAYVGKNPNSWLSIGLSYFPFFTPFLMMNRIAATPPPHSLEVIGATLLLLVAIWCTTWAGAKLFRVGVLMYGKPPRIGEVWKLLRSPEGRAMMRPREAS